MKKSIAFLLMAVSFIFISAYDEGMFDSGFKIDSIYSDYRELDIISASKIVSTIWFGNVFFDDIESAFFIDNGKNNRNEELFSFYKSKEYKKIISINPSDYIQSFMKALSYYNLSMYREAIGVLDSLDIVCSCSVDSIRAILTAASYYNLKENEKAVSLLEKYNDDYSLLIKGLIKYEQGFDDSVLNLLSQLQSDRIEPQRSYLLLNAYYRKRDYSNTMTMIERFESKYPDFAWILNLKYIKAQILYKKGYFKRSIISLQDIVLGSDSNSILLGNAYYLIGKNYFMLGDYDRMEEYLSIVQTDAAKSDFKKNAEFLDGKGFFLKGDFKKASGKLTKFVDKYPDDELTQYAYQLLAQAFFYQKNYKKSQLYISKLKIPSFFADKLVLMKYFIDYKNNLYSDSITAYLDFISKETGNPMRRETYEIIVKEAENESLKIWAFDNLNKEYPESENIPVFASALCNIIIKNCSAEQMQRIVSNVNKYRFEKFESLYMQFMRELYKKNCFQSIVDFYSRYARDLEKNKNEATYITALSLKEMKNIDGALFMLDGLSRGEGEFKDSSAVKKATIYYEIYDADYLKKFITEESEKMNTAVQGELYRIYGKKLHDQKRFEEAKSAFLQAVDLFKDNRNMAALALLDCSITSLKTGNRDEAMIFAEKAILLATDIEVINKLKVHLDAIE